MKVVNREVGKNCLATVLLGRRCGAEVGLGRGIVAGAQLRLYHVLVVRIVDGRVLVLHVAVDAQRFAQ